MTRSFFFPIALFGLLAALFTLNACQKDVDLADQTTPVTHATQRYQVFYGVTVASPGKPSQLVEINQASGLVTNVLPIQLDQGGGNFLPVNDVRGICYMGNGKYIISTGPDPIDFLSNALMDLDVTTGTAYFLSSSTVGTVSDIDFDPLSGNIYGLRGNNIVTISGGGYTNYAMVAMAGLPAGYTAKGLTMIGDINIPSTQVNIALTQNGNFGTTFVYKVNPASGVTGFIAQLLPNAQLSGGNCSLSFQLQPGSEMYINRNTSNVFPGLGLNRLGGWPNQGVVATGVYGANGFNFEDLSSDVGL